MKVCGDFGVLVFFLVNEIILVFVAFVELLGLVYASFLFMKVWCLCLVLQDIELGTKVLLAHHGGGIGHASAGPLGA
jgi:hypothetical protein